MVIVGIETRKDRRVRLPARAFPVVVVFAALASVPVQPAAQASAHAGDLFGPACGAATIDGRLSAGEWSGASRRTFQMRGSGMANALTATLCVMNDGRDLYLAITINDDEYTTVGTWLPQGDGFRIDFDNDHSGSLFALGDEVLDVSAGLPQWEDCHICLSASTSARADVDGGGTSDGAGAASRLNGLNHFELRHPLCSGDSKDFCLSAADTVGFRLEYLDAQADGSFGGSQFFPGSGNSSEAEIVVGHCLAPHRLAYLPLVRK